MGIPSYFRRILQKFPACVKSTLKTPELLCFDFNCLIYRCLRSPTLPPFTEETQDQWENSLCEEVCRTVKEVWAEAGRPKAVYLAVDGVVPMAKMHQQRLRRYKSPYLKEWENDIKKKYGVFKEELLDTNQITPGTPFMSLLGESIEDAIKRQYFGKIPVNFSGANSPGEGEHKILNMIREDKIKDSEKICIYGLDAEIGRAHV